MNEKCILIVDDEQRMRKIIKDFLRAKGFSILEAEDGEKALEVFEENRNKISLILLDVMMPKLDGWSVLRQIRQDSKVPIIMLTARGEEQDELFGFELGVDEYISKPFSPKILVARVEAILKRTNQTQSFAKDYGGIELDKEAFYKSQQLKLNTINGDFREMDKIEEQFDVIMLCEVIEHLQDLNVFMDLAYKKLKVNGRIILSTPNYNKIVNYPTREKDQLFQNEPPVHLNFFTITSIKNVFYSFQFQNIKVRIKKYPYLELSKKRFYINFVKAIFNRYEGPTIYLEAIKKG